MIGQKQLDQHFTGAFNFLAASLHLHPGLDLADTSGLGNTRTLNLDGANTADRHRMKARIMAKHRDSNAKFAGRIPDRRAFGHGNVLTINGQSDSLRFLEMQVSHDSLSVCQGAACHARLVGSRLLDLYTCNSRRFSSGTNPLSSHPRAL